MAIFSQYGTGQRVGFIFVCVGFSMCFIGSIAPYWITAKTSIKDLADYPSVGDITLYDIRIGIWYYCVEWLLEEKCYSFYDTSDYKGPDKDEDRFAWINVVRFFIVVNILLGLLSGLVACCRCMCCSGGRTICHGVLSFFAGASGFCAFAIFDQKTESLLNIPFQHSDNNWAMGLFTLGSILLVIASLILCCALPRENTYGVVMAPAAAPGGININVANTNSNVNQYNASGNVQSFEPLPNVARYPPAAGYPSQPYHHNVQPMGFNNPHPPSYDYNQPGAIAGNFNNPNPMTPADQTLKK